MGERVLLAFSGGIDSSAAVGLLRDRGFDVVAMTIDMLGDNTLREKALSCAESLGVKLHIIDGSKLFEREIINNFTNEYLSGRTPAPCTRCNTLVKWRLLLDLANELDIFHIATGHYFRITEEHGKRYVTRGCDQRKDQSYYLWGLSQEVLQRAVTPMGEVIKADVMSRNMLPQRESMGVCFLKSKPYSDFICERCGEMTEGEIVNQSGEVIGRHNGIARYTIGQRRGEGIPAGLRVIEMDGEQNKLIVGDNKLLFHRKLIVYDCYFADIDEVTTSTTVSVMIRGIGLNPEGYASVRVIPNDNTELGIAAEVTLSNPAWATAPGQPVVFYIGERVIGGGYLHRSFIE